MAKFFKVIRNFFLGLWNFRTNRKLNNINNTLERTLRQRQKERKVFIKSFMKELRKYFKYDASGKYIPLKGKNKALVFEHFNHKYGDRFKELDLKFTRKLEIKE